MVAPKIIIKAECGEAHKGIIRGREQMKTESEESNHNERGNATEGGTEYLNEGYGSIKHQNTREKTLKRKDTDQEKNSKQSITRQGWDELSLSLMDHFATRGRISRTWGERSSTTLRDHAADSNTG